MRRLRLSWVMLAAALTLAGCASLPRGPGPQEQAQIAQARQLFEQGHYQQSARAYLALATQGGADAGHLRLAAADALRKAGNTQKLAHVLSHIQRGNLPPADAY